MPDDRDAPPLDEEPPPPEYADDPYADAGWATAVPGAPAGPAAAAPPPAPGGPRAAPAPDREASRHAA